MFKVLLDKPLFKKILKNPSIQDRNEKSLRFIEEFQTSLLDMNRNEAEEKLTQLKDLLPHKEYIILANVYNDFPIESNHYCVKNRIERVKESLN